MDARPLQGMINTLMTRVNPIHSLDPEKMQQRRQSDKERQRLHRKRKREKEELQLREAQTKVAQVNSAAARAVRRQQTPEAQEDTPHKEWTKPAPGKTPREKVADMIGKVVEIPGAVFAVDVPGLVYRATVSGPDKSHNDAVIVRMKDDNNKYFFPIGQVREWLDATQLRHEGSEVPPGEQQTTSEQSDEFAAEILTSIRGRATSQDHDQDDYTDTMTEHEPVTERPAPTAKPPASLPAAIQEQLPLPGPTTNANGNNNANNNNNSTAQPPIYTAQATSMAVLAAFELGFRMAYNLCTGAGTSPAQMLTNTNQQ